MMEQLFARSGQIQAFLYLTGCGVVFGMLLHLTRGLRMRGKVLCALTDLCCSAALLGMLLAMLLAFDGGVRFYGLLGLLIGLALYSAGVRTLVDGAVKQCRKLLSKRQKTFVQKEGFSQGCGELLPKDDLL